MCFPVEQPISISNPEVMLLMKLSQDIVVQHLPLFFCGAASAAALLLGGALSTIPFVLFGTYFGWFYLRFLQIKPELGLQ